MTHLSYREDIDVMVMTIEGQVDISDYQNALDTLFRDEHFRPNLDVIWDLRKADMSRLPSGHVRDIASMAGESADRRGTHWRTALVVENDLVYGLARMFETFSNGAPYRLGIFRTMQEAEAWMKEELG